MTTERAIDILEGLDRRAMDAVNFAVKQDMLQLYVDSQAQAEALGLAIQALKEKSAVERGGR